MRRHDPEVNSIAGVIVSEEMQLQAKALADPSRFRLFEHIASATAPVLIADLTDLLGFNHNAIRQHLAILVGAGLVDEQNEVRTTRGRPRKIYALRSDALSAFGSISGSYETLAGLLLELADSDDSPYEVGRRSGAHSPLDPSGGVGRVTDLLRRRLASDGFEPTTSDAGITTLHHCPFADVAGKNPGVVCEIHRGLIDGYLSAKDGATAGLEIHEPHRAGCRVTLNVRA